MATYVENLATIRDQIAERLVEITASPKPSYMLNGQMVQWTAYFNALTQQLDKLNELIATGDGGPVEVLSQGYT